MVFLCGASSRGEQASPLRRAFSTSVLSRGLDDRSSFFELTQAQPTWRDKKSHGEASRCPSDHACRGGVTVPLSILHYRTRFLAELAFAHACFAEPASIRKKRLLFTLWHF